jgi:N-acetylglucosaminylphosphatidylinositol deacetylase
MTALLTLAWQIPLLLTTLYLLTTWTTPHHHPPLTNHRIALIIAHPDDEAMFFAPTLRALTDPTRNNHVTILCFTTGDADGLGHIRRGELIRSALLLGVRDPEHVVVLDEPARFPDAMGVAWDAERVAERLGRVFTPPPPPLSRTGDLSPPPTTTTEIDVLITFDEGGVSRHPNHVSLLHGCVAFVRAVARRREGRESPIQLYTLTSTNVVRKYASVVDAVVTVVMSLARRRERGVFPSPLVMVSSPADVRRAQRAMTTAHQSQMRWFRWGWIGISRYMVVNDLVKRKVL